MTDPNAIANEPAMGPAQVPPGYVRVRFRDPDLEHQLAQFFAGEGIAVSCNCLRMGPDDYEVIEVREQWTADEALAVWREHIKDITEGK